MAEVLATIASAIALGQATAAILKGSQMVARLPKAPAEFHDLLNEVRPNHVFTVSLDSMY